MFAHSGISENDQPDLAKFRPKCCTIGSNDRERITELHRQEAGMRECDVVYFTFVPDQPNRNAASCAKSSPKPSIKPLTNGSSKLIAAPRSRPHIVGGVYNIIGEVEDEGGDGDRSLWLPDE